jgi:hypothetical protein
VIGLRAGALAALLIAAGLALWWRYGLIIALAEPAWFCLPR